jgi:hypothetical protein
LKAKLFEITVIEEGDIHPEYLFMCENLDFESCPTILIFLDRDKNGIAVSNTSKGKLEGAIPLGEVEIDDDLVKAAYEYLCIHAFMKGHIPDLAQITYDVESDILLQSIKGGSNGS